MSYQVIRERSGSFNLIMRESIMLFGELKRLVWEWKLEGESRKWLSKGSILKKKFER
jgi:hypothetical protein